MRAFGSVRVRRFAVRFAMVWLGWILVAGCGGERAAPDAEDPGELRINHNLSTDLTGDGTPERISVAATGPQIDSLDVQLEIRSAEDSVLYASSWNTRFYFQYEDRSSMSDSAADAKVRRMLERVVEDSAIRINTAGLTGDTDRLAMVRDAIRFNIATHEWRRANSLPPGKPLPPTAHDPINVLAAKVDPARIDSLVSELKGRKTFWFHAGGEVSYAIAWSDQERRFVTVHSCC